MKKRLFSMGLVLLMVLTMFPMSCYATEMGIGLKPDITQDILSKYQREIALVEEKYGHSIDQISPTTRKEIASVANHYLYNPKYRFSELMTDIAAASSNRGEMSPMGSTGGEVWQAYGPITGKFIKSLPAASSVTLSDSVTVSVSADFFPGFNISGERSVSVEYSFSGPEQGATLFNGMRATHNYACAIMFGTVKKEGSRYYIEDMNGEAFVSYAAVTAKGNLYVDAGGADYDSSGYWVSLNDFKEYLVTNPEFYLRGNS